MGLNKVWADRGDRRGRHDRVDKKSINLSVVLVVGIFVVNSLVNAAGFLGESIFFFISFNSPVTRVSAQRQEKALMSTSRL